MTMAHKHLDQDGCPQELKFVGNDDAIEEAADIAARLMHIMEDFINKSVFIREHAEEIFASGIAAFIEDQRHDFGQILPIDKFDILEVLDARPEEELDAE